MKKKQLSVIIILLALVIALAIGFRLGRADTAQQGAVSTPEFSGGAALVTLAPNDAPADPAPEPSPSASIPTESPADPAPDAASTDPAPDAAPAEDGSYDTKDAVALYLHTYGRLPPNYVTKTDAKKAGWEGGSLEKYYPGCSIGGDVFGNREGLLPDAPGRVYYECDIDTTGKSSRGAKRIVFSNDGLIYYTDDHYDSFTLLYGEDAS